MFISLFVPLLQMYSLYNYRCSLLVQSISYLTYVNFFTLCLFLAYLMVTVKLLLLGCGGV